MHLSSRNPPNPHLVWQEPAHSPLGPWVGGRQVQSSWAILRRVQQVDILNYADGLKVTHQQVTVLGSSQGGCCQEAEACLPHGQCSAEALQKTHKCLSHRAATDGEVNLQGQICNGGTVHAIPSLHL